MKPAAPSASRSLSRRPAIPPQTDIALLVQYIKHEYNSSTLRMRPAFHLAYPGGAFKTDALLNIGDRKCLVSRVTCMRHLALPTNMQTTNDGTRRGAREATHSEHFRTTTNHVQQQHVCGYLCHEGVALTKAKIENGEEEVCTDCNLIWRGSRGHDRGQHARERRRGSYRQSLICCGRATFSLHYMSYHVVPIISLLPLWWIPLMPKR